MHIVNGIAYASEPSGEIMVEDLKLLDDMMMIVVFNTGEKRLFDATQLLQYPTFAPLMDDSVFKSVQVEWGVVTWCNSELDIAPEFVYENSHPYQEVNFDT